MKRTVIKKPTKLQLDRHTLRELAPEACEQVQGGMSPVPTSGRPTCNCLFNC